MGQLKRSRRRPAVRTASRKGGRMMSHANADEDEEYSLGCCIVSAMCLRVMTATNHWAHKNTQSWTLRPSSATTTIWPDPSRRTGASVSQSSPKACEPQVEQQGNNDESQCRFWPARPVNVNVHWVLHLCNQIGSYIRLE